MQKVTVTELETNMDFQAEIDMLPDATQNYSSVYIDDQEVKRSGVRQMSGTIKIKPNNPSDEVTSFLGKWNVSKKRIDLMLETGDSVYLLKHCSVRKFDTSKKVFYIPTYQLTVLCK